MALAQSGFFALETNLNIFEIMSKDTSKKNHRLLVTCLLLIVFVLSTEIARAIYRANLSGERRALKTSQSILAKRKKISTKNTDKTVSIELVEKAEEKDWEKYGNVSEGQNCSAGLKWFKPEVERPIVAISRVGFQSHLSIPFFRKET